MQDLSFLSCPSFSYVRMASIWYTGNTKIWLEFSCDEHVLISGVVLVLMCPSMNEPKEWLRVVERAAKEQPWRLPWS